MLQGHTTMPRLFQLPLAGTAPMFALDVQDPAQCIQLFQLQKLTLKKGEDMFQKLSTVYYSSMAQGCSLAVMIDVPEENVGANIYLGVREDPLKKNMKSRDLDTSSKALQKVLSSNFPGSDTCNNAYADIFQTDFG